MTAAQDGQERRGGRAGGSPGSTGVRRVTIQDVAKAAQVSVSAVSKVLRDAYGVSPEMRTKVNAAIEELGYRPQAGARAMRGSSYTVGVMLVALSHPFQPEIVEGVTDELDPTPYQEILVTGGLDTERQQRSVEALMDRGVDGLVVISPAMSTSWLERLGESLPTVVVARHGGAAGYDTVVDDDQGGARLMVDHLVGLGHRRILHTTHPMGGLERPHVLAHTARLDGFVAAMKRHGLKPDVIETSFTEEGGHQAALEALSRPTPPTAIFAGADIAALGVLRAAEEHGLRVPEDLTVTGYDNVNASSIGRVSLTTVDQSGHLTGQMSARLLLERLEGRTRPVHYVVAPRLLPRGTSAAPVARGRAPKGLR
ncbi:LacI family DNA-binding transcriptional regulator [Streptomyces turgidiscabies]|uniref:Periplasmic binding protein and sugar binding domain of the LacI family protein n=1 Tax=Streptomyces turgidiscabies (strain Car8) TaxID=698760 RepID=L7EZ22_STRT8|nr:MULTISPECIES: LacI family DNA-binding transcriptional regulator [Streptomyces]ELP64678.1 periplasmic binding protein and sugar binding domain of the LacI family protein [Streptomyces turgidiscabies Car8]MDX3498111.1 LacI family DNA-binding transcriptional regulator [Streptomyces turgidiscabies]